MALIFTQSVLGRVPSWVVLSEKPRVALLKGSAIGTVFQNLLTGRFSHIGHHFGVFGDRVLARTTKKLQVGKSVIGAVMVLVVNHLATPKEAAKLLLHLQAMLRNITLFTSERVLGSKKIDVAVPVDTPTFPAISVFCLHIGIV